MELTCQILIPHAEVPWFTGLVAELSKHGLQAVSELGDGRGWDGVSCTPCVAILLHSEPPEPAGRAVRQHLALWEARGLVAPPLLAWLRHEDTGEHEAALDAGAQGVVIGGTPCGRRAAAYVRAMLRRREPSAVLRSGALELDLISRSVTLGGRTVDLTPTQFCMLALLVAREGSTVSRSELVHRSPITGAALARAKTVDAHICALRSRLGDFGERIVAVRSEGYGLFVAGPPSRATG